VHSAKLMHETPKPRDFAVEVGDVLVVGDKYQVTRVTALHHITAVSCFGTYLLPRASWGDASVFSGAGRAPNFRKRGLQIRG